MSCATVTGGRVGGTMCGASRRLDNSKVVDASLLAAHTPDRGAHRPPGLGAAMALAGAESRLRRRHRRRRRARPGHRLLPRQGAWAHQHRRAREGVDRRRQHRAQHHHHPLQLPLRRERRDLRACREAVGGPVAGAQLQRHVLPARRDDARPQRARRAEPQAPHLRQPAERHRQRVADAASRPRRSARRSTSRRDMRYPVVGAALQRRGGVARHDAVAWGYARGADAGASTSSRTARCWVPARPRRRHRRRRDLEGAIRTRAWASLRRATPAW